MSIKLPSLLAYTRSITPSVGVFFGVESKQDLFNYKKRLPVQITKVGLAAGGAGCRSQASTGQGSADDRGRRQGCFIQVGPGRLRSESPRPDPGRWSLLP